MVNLERIKRYFTHLPRKYFRQFTGFQLYWLIGTTLTILAVNFIETVNTGAWDWLSLAAALSFQICVVLVACKRISNWLWGTVNVVLYGICYWKWGVYGYSLLNWLFYLPIQAIGLYMWINRQVFYDLVAPRKLSKLWLFVSIGALGATVFLTTVLNRYDTAMSAFGLTGFWDALAVTMGIFGQLFMNLAHWMQWVPWIIEDFAMFVISIGQGNFTMAATWLIGWLNAVFGLYWWCKRVTEFERPMRTKEDLF